MTDHERIQRTFAQTICKHGERPQLHYEPGCHYIECEWAEKCKCRLVDGDNAKTSPILIEWKRRFS